MEEQRCPIVVTIQDTGYTFDLPISLINDETLSMAKNSFEEYRKKGIIDAENFDSGSWRISNGPHKVTISFQINRDGYEKCLKDTLESSYSFIQKALRIYCILSIANGVALNTVKKTVVAIQKFLGGKQYPKNRGLCNALENFLLILPHENVSKLELIDELTRYADQIQPQAVTDNKRTMAYYRSYVVFDRIIKDFWSTADDEQKKMFFPVWFWWEISGILPLRATCIVLTPRRCIRESCGKYYLSIRRTRLKKKTGSRYSIESDYEKKEYRIPKEHYQEIEKYLSMTEDEYESDIDVLFSKNTQFKYLNIRNPNDNHYSYANLNQCIDAFYRKIIVEKYQCTTEEQNYLLPNYIERISVGDTRVFSMISLFITGNSSVICKELCGHEWPEMSSHYYSNLKSFLDAFSFSVFRPEDIAVYNYSRGGLVTEDFLKVEGGYCCSERARRNDFSQCAEAVDKQGRICQCKVCRDFSPEKKTAAFLSENSSSELEKEYLLIVEEIDLVRKGAGMEENVEMLLKRFRAESRQYMRNAVIKQYLEGI